MLLEFKVKNFCSIGDEVTLSMLAGQEKRKEEELLQFEKYNVLPSGIIYGSNGTGKTNILKAMKFLQDAVMTSYNNSPETVLSVPCHKALQDESSLFSVQFEMEGTRYAYEVELKQGAVETECLYYFPNKRESRIFERTGNGIEYGRKFKNDFSLVKEALKPGRLFLSCAANLSQNEELNNAYLYFSRHWILDHSSGDAWLSQSIQMLSSDRQMKDNFFRFIKSLDIPIRDFRIDQEIYPVEELDIPDFMRDIFKQAKASEITDTRVLLEYEKFFIDLNEESSGIQKLFRVLCPIIDALEHGYLIFFDEFENGLHEFLVSRIIQIFNSYAHLHNAQLLLITHDTSLLSPKLFRRDQIWFTEITPGNRYTDLYSMVELKGIRQNENFRNNYIEGKYGGIPMLGSWIMNEDTE